MAGTLTGSERPTVTVEALLQDTHTKDAGSGSTPQAARLGRPGSGVWGLRNEVSWAW